MNVKLRLSLSAATVAIALVAASAFAAPGSAESQLHTDAAKRVLGKGDSAAAVIELKNAVRADPSNSEARYQLALLYLAQGHTEGAVAELETARTRGFDPGRVMPLLAQAYVSLGRFREAQRLSVDGLPGEAKAAVLAAQARAYIALDDRVKAREVVNQALGLSPNLRSAIMASAMLSMAEGKFAEAEAELAKAEGKAEQPDLLMLKAELRQKQRDLDGALAELDRAAAQFPLSVAVRVQRATINIMRNNLPAVRTDVDWVLVQQPQNRLGLFLRAYVLATDKKYSEASQTLLALPDLLDRYTPAMYLLAETTLQEGRVEISLDYAQRYLAHLPDNPQGLKLLARVHQRMGKHDRAVAVLEPLAARFPEDTEAKLQLANALLEAGRSDEAVKLFEQSIAKNPNNSEAQLALAVGQLRAGAPDQAVSRIESVVKGAPDSLQANTLLVLTHLQLSQTDKALAAAKAMVAANPNNPNAYNMEGTVHLAVRNHAAARSAFQAALAKDAKFLPAALNLARTEERAGNRSAAVGWYERALTIDPLNMTAYMGLANIAVVNDDIARATSYLKQAASRDETAIEPRLRLVDILLERKQNDQALIEARSLANVAQKSPQALDALARAQLASGDIEGGLASYKRLAGLNPDNAEAQRRLGRAFMSVADKSPATSPYREEARAAFEKAVTLAPDDLTVLGDRIDFERRTSDAAAALALAERYASARPDSVARMVVLGDTQLIANQPAAASATYARAWQKGQSSYTVVRHYTGLTLTGKSEAAEQLLKTWTTQRRSDYDVRFLLANHYLKAGKTREAIAENEALSAAFPENAAVLNNLAWLYADQNPTKALELAERAHTLAPESPDVLDTAGWLQASHGDAARGEILLRKAHDAAPERADISFHYAVALDRNQKSSDAKAVLTRTLAKETAFAERTQAQALLNKLSAVR